MSSTSPEPLPALRGLFQQRLAGDDALLELARLRFAQAGLAAEVYADGHGQLDHILGFAPPAAPVVHLGRGIDLLAEDGRAHVEAFARRFTPQVWGLVVHDRKEMMARTDELITTLTRLGARLAQQPGGPWVLLEYAAGNDPGWFADVAARLAQVERVSLCIDVGHLGIRTARAAFAREHRGLDLATITPADPRLPDQVGDVQRAVSAALPAVVELTGALGRIGKPLHFHLHDGHPLVPGLADHFSFLTRLPIPFTYEGRASLAPLYGPAGLAAILRAGLDACGAERLSLTLEIHQAEGRLPLGDAAGLFEHWRDVTNAERMNYWLAVLAENALLASDALDRARAPMAGLPA